MASMEEDGGQGLPHGSVTGIMRRRAEEAARAAQEATEAQFRQLLAQVRTRLADAERGEKRQREKALRLQRELREQERITAALAEEVQRLRPVEDPPEARATAIDLSDEEILDGLGMVMPGTVPAGAGRRLSPLNAEPGED